jgi:hypothetical protein
MLILFLEVPPTIQIPYLGSLTIEPLLNPIDLDDPYSFLIPCLDGLNTCNCLRKNCIGFNNIIDLLIDGNDCITDAANTHESTQ